MLVLLNVLFPQFCISFVSGPTEEDQNKSDLKRSHITIVSVCLSERNQIRRVVPTSKQHQSEAPLGVPQRAASQQDLLVVQWVFLAAVC